MQDIDETIVLGWEALEPCLQGHVDRSGLLGNLAHYL